MTHSIGLSPELVEYINRHNIAEHPVMRKCREETALRYPEDEWFQISLEQASFMAMIVRLTGARRILEIGTFNGYSAMSFALAANAFTSGGSEIITFDKNLEWCANAQGYFDDAGLAGNITLIQGDATETLPSFLSGRNGDFDLCFIDADKANTTNYLDQCYLATRKGGLIIIDNILWDGKVLSDDVTDLDTMALKRCAGAVQQDSRFVATMCSIGDGLLFCQK